MKQHTNNTNTGEIFVKNTDKSGDTFVKGYERYTDGNPNIVREHLEQLCDNYERCFDKQPTPEQLDNALKFCYMLCAEIGECYPKSIYAMAASKLSSIIDDGLTTAENIADLANANIPTS